MKSDEIRLKFLKFFENRGHKIIPSSSLVPENDPSVLFNTAGMQQFKPYYTNPQNADKDFGNRNIVTIQKCIRTGDIDEVGDSTHLTFFEMLGNFSFGGYGRKEAITYAYEFITKEMNLEISYVSIYEGSKNVPKDAESEKIWKELGIEKIKKEGSDVFWGPTGDSGPCGPTTEIYCKNGADNDVEIWNIVFNEYFCDGSREKLDRGEATLKKLDVLGVDTGMGLERLMASVQNKKSVYDTDVFKSALSALKDDAFKVVGHESDIIKAERIVLDHFRTVLFMASDGVIPSNKDKGYIMRRLLRRSIIYFRKISWAYIEHYMRVFDAYVEKYKSFYPGLETVKKSNYKIILEEINQFQNSLENGLKEVEKLAKRRFWGIDGLEGDKMMMVLGEDAFDLWQNFGFPIELTMELANERGMTVDSYTFELLKENHSKKSQIASAGMFKGGLANHNEKTVRLHTAHHLLLAGLQIIVNKNIKQRGSNITEERLRMDFLCDHKLTDGEKKKVEDWVNDKIKDNLNVIYRAMPLLEAEKLGAEMEFGAKYPEIVSLYFIEDKKGNFISKEFCGGPHVSNTKELGQFKIQKEEAVAQGIRRIKAVLL